MATIEIPKTRQTSATRIGLGCAGIQMKPDEFDAITDYDDLYRYELIHGVLVVNPIPLESEAGPNELLGRLLGNFQEQHPQGASLDATLPERFVYIQESRRRADRVIWTGLGRQPKPKEDVPTIVVEFVSAGKRNYVRDYVEKRHDYLEIGVVEYWIIDRFRRTMTVFRQGSADAAEQVVTESETYITPLLPGFELPLARLLAVADAWGEDEL
jgi:Uma2 family endonuclease